MSTAIAKLAERFALGNASEATEILKATAFKGPATDAQMTALCVVAQQYGLNPFTRELYAFPDRNNGIVPVVGVDGWSRIINDNAQFDGMDFKQDDESCTCTIYRKDRSHPIVVTEYMTECKRDVAPWKSHPRRMLRHKAMIQCARLAFGFAGIYDQDEAERIAEAAPIEGTARRVTEAPALPVLSDELLATAEAEAAKGYASFSAWWETVSEDDGAALTPRLKELTKKARAVTVEQRTEASQ
jgi:phage recombination protein Bet